MPEWLLNMDISVFRFINSTLSNPAFDYIMPYLTEFRYWLPVYLLMFAWLFTKGGRNGRICALLLILTIILTDQVSASYIKAEIARIRPCHTLGHINLLVHCGGGKSFPSSHAANNFGAALILSFFFRKNSVAFFSIAAIVAFSRVYVGVHYPVDVTGGAILGMAIAALVLVFYKYFPVLIRRFIKTQTAGEIRK